MKSILVICVAFAAFEISCAQVIRSIAPGIISGISSCGCGCSSPIISPVIPPCSSPIISPCSSSIIPPCSSSIIAPAIPSCSSPIISVMQPNSVAASLADTLSLLTVSSLLAETLPYGCNMMLPPCGCGLGCGGYYY